jgi:hypothetical protein
MRVVAEQFGLCQQHFDRQQPCPRVDVVHVRPASFQLAR